jgi:hypothetical protein
MFGLAYLPTVEKMGKPTVAGGLSHFLGCGGSKCTQISSLPSNLRLILGEKPVRFQWFEVLQVMDIQRRRKSTVIAGLAAS